MKVSNRTRQIKTTARKAIIGTLVGVSILLCAPTTTTAAPNQQAEFHIVQQDETWRDIAAQYGITPYEIWRANGVINPAQISAGQRLFIPTTEAARDLSFIRYEVGNDISTIWAALLSGNTVSSLLHINGMSSAASAFGQVIAAPDIRDRVGSIAQAPTPAPTSEPAAPPAPTAIPENALVRAQIGVQGIFFLEDDADRGRLLDLVAYDAGFGWVKQQIRWEEFEYAPGQYNQERLELMDAIIQDAFQRGLDILLSVSTAPDWARNTTELNGPPVDYEAYYTFLRFIVDRYKYRIDAVEVWNEPNLQREWVGAPMHGAEYVRLLAGAREVIKSAYPEGNLIVVSAGLAPTGVNDGVSAVDDRVYLRQMYDAGLANYADVIGIHPYSWGNPPWTRCCGDWGGAPTHNDHPSFFFLNTVEDYRAIQVEYGDSGRQLWATEFGWATMDGIGRAVPADTIYMNYVSADQQADYILEALRMGQEWDFMGPMFLWNLNIATFPEFDDEQSAYSILYGNNVYRPAFERLQSTPKIDS